MNIDAQNDFGPFEDQIWLNSASEGPLPKVAVKALNEAARWKVNPVLLTTEKFAQVPAHLKAVLGQLIHAPAKDIILGNSATYGIHLLSNGIPWEKGDEILVMQNDFPTDILPWLALEKKGVQIRQIASKAPILQPQELDAHITRSTKLFCVSHIHTFTGHVADIQQLGSICQERGVICVANLTQTLGNTPVDIAKLPVDAITSSGFKWLCGPYGTGFCWIRPELRDRLEYNHAFWVSLLNENDLTENKALTLPQAHGARKYDVFGTANFFNFHPWRTSIEYLLQIGIDQIHQHNHALIEHFIQKLDRDRYHLISPQEQTRRSCLVVVSHKDPAKNLQIFELLKQQGLHGAFWKGNMRFSPHICNREEDMDRLIAVLNSLN